jgi:hypothetical protein
MLADRGLLERELACGAGEAAAVGDGEETAQQQRMEECMRLDNHDS